MFRLVRIRTLFLSLLLVATALLIPVSASDAALDHLVQAPGVDLRARGIDVIDDYGSFATARLTASDVARLAAEGIGAAPLTHALGRAGLDATSIAPGLEAPIDAPLQVVQFRGPVKAEWRAMLDARAIAVYDYLPDHAYLVRLAPGVAEELRALAEIRAVSPYHPAWKIAPEVHTEGVARVTALAFLEAPLADVVAGIAATGALPAASTTAQLEHVIDVMATPAQVRAMARLDAVSWIEPAYDEASTDNAQSSAITQGGATGAWPLHAKGVDGSSQKTSVCDTGANTDPAVPLVVPGAPLNVVRMVHEMHDDSAQRNVVYNEHLSPLPNVFGPHRKMDLYYSPRENNATMGDADDADGHGTHTSGTLAGDAPPYGVRSNNDGVAFGAKLLVCDITTGSSFNILNNYANYWDPAYARGARVNSNSWGSSHTATYTEKARQHDAYVWENRDMVILRSVGNIPNALRPESVAKSALGIGATGNGANLNNIASFSGNGPTQDGRIKPDIVAPGDCLTSSYLSGATSYACLSGTSMSTPTVAGAATLVRDYFVKGFYPSGSADNASSMNPSTALVKAVLTVSGREITGDRSAVGFPNQIQGYGRVTLDDTLYFAGDAKKLRVFSNEGSDLTTGQVFSANFTVAAGQPLRVMLTWSDRAAAAGANPTLVNNLDLRVIDPNGVVLGTPDTKNVSEGVIVANPVSGTYTVTVTGANVPMGPQPFALVATGGL